MITTVLANPDQSIGHITKENWENANLLLIKKALSEFAHEQLIIPVLEGQHKYAVSTPDGKIKYTFKAKVLSLHHWSIEVNSIQKFVEDKKVFLSLTEFIIEFKSVLGIPEMLLPTYLEEITSTIYSTAFKISNQKFTASELVNQEYQEIEHAMTEGHPCFLANSGKNGFNSLDFINYSPEANSPVQMIWLAGHKSRATFSCIESLNYDKVIQQELDIEDYIAFKNTIKSKGLDTEDYYIFPVHPWQWFNKLTMIFSEDIAFGKLICLGYGKDIYSAQQSIRTFFNLSNPEKFYAKTALSVINMGFMRGLSPYYMESTPAITMWVDDLVKKDAYLQEKGFTLLGEVATLGYRNFLYEPLGRAIPHNKMLATLWRESPIPKLEQSQKCMTMAALLHVDNEGKAFVKELIDASGISPKQWISHYLDSYLSPLLHCFYKHEMVFMPHGENLILVLEDNIPVKAIMKDITEEVMIFNPNIPLPEKAKRIYIDMDEKLKVLCLQNDIFEFFFRFLVAILHENKVMHQDEFWALVSNCILEYQIAHPALQSQFEKYDLFVSEFDACCLNRLQLKNNKQMLDLTTPTESLQFVGKLKNPIHSI
jgi:siderophore synthetase component